jgi:hypothetical protein
MASLRSTTAGQLAKYVGSTVETITNSMISGSPVYRSGSSPSTVYVLNNAQNKAIIDQFVSLGSSGRPALERQSYELQLSCRNNKVITIGSIDKPTVRANLGDVSEGIFAAAIAARFIYKNRAISASQVYAVLASLRASGTSTYPGKKGMVAEITRPSPNAGIVINDDVKLRVELAESNMRFLLNTVGNRGALDPYVIASVNYANSKTVRDWAELVYMNRRYDKIEVMAEGLSGQRFSKVDVRVKITNDEGQLLPVNINVSLKAGDVKQFGQLGGTEYSDLVNFFNRLFGVGSDLVSVSQKYEKMTKVEHKYFDALRMIYKKVNDSLSSRLLIKTKSNILLDNMGQGITYYATLNEENVQLVQLDNREAKVYQFTNVSEKIKEYDYRVRYTESGEKGLPQLDIVNSSNGKLLLRIRVKGENKVDKRTGKSYTYFRNYVEKGEFLGELIASYV